MEITYHGLGCFRLVERGLPTTLTEPFDEAASGLTLPKGKIDIVTTSEILDEPERATWPGLPPGYHTLAGPGEYEIGGLFILAAATPRNRRRSAVQAQNTIFVFSYNAITVCHLGQLGALPSQAQLEKLGPVHVLLLPVGLPDGMSPTVASEVVSMFEPQIVVPMQYRLPGLRQERAPVGRFLKEMGLAEPEAVPGLKLTAPPESEEVQVVLLEALGA